ncbi:high affinity copper uptake protein 1 [Condylostylus longicornis]|uniref:high affinity copper uptake protein 1 n=1 Tax=Condylostylus longicornis TaxID=2530218 RepID=UPI00244DA2AF|nr:high affinity copper uptake protein 1 [Condylostylus longicornis]
MDHQHMDHQHMGHHNMDHSTMHNHGGHGDDDMKMYFHAGTRERILWEGWKTESDLQFGLSCLALIAVSFLYEGLRYIRERFYHKVAKDEALKLMQMQNGQGCCAGALPHVERTITSQIFNKSHAIQTILHVIQITVSYLLMLVFMTFNYWLCLSVLIGCTLGYFCFGWIKQNAIDSNDHCH